MSCPYWDRTGVRERRSATTFSFPGWTLRSISKHESRSSQRNMRPAYFALGFKRYFRASASTMAVTRAPAKYELQTSRAQSNARVSISHWLYACCAGVRLLLKYATATNFPSSFSCVRQAPIPWGEPSDSIVNPLSHWGWARTGCLRQAALSFSKASICFFVNFFVNPPFCRSGRRGSTIRA